MNTELFEQAEQKFRLLIQNCWKLLRSSALQA